MVELQPGTYRYNCLRLESGAILRTPGDGVTILTQCFVLDEGASIIGSPTYYGPLGQGSSSSLICGEKIMSLAGGGGHGTAGLRDCQFYPIGNCSGCADGGKKNDNLKLPKYGGGSGGSSLNGGALIKIVVVDFSTQRLAPATINGTIDMNGGDGFGAYYSHCGGGAGGAILIEASTLSGTGTLQANGGAAGGCGPGHGGGGIISLITDASAFSGNFAEQGMFTDAAVVTITTPPTSGYF